MKVSVVVPTAKRPDALSKCLDSLLKQTFPRESYEIIVVFDGAKPSSEFVESVADYNIVVVGSKKNKGPAAARNKGIKEAQGEVIAFTDDDCMVDKNWVRIMYEAHIKFADVACVGGNTVTRKDNMPARISQNLSNESMFFKDFPIYFPTCNISFKRGVFKHMTFNETFKFPAGEDLEFGWRLLKEGYKLKYVPQAAVLHNCHTGGVKSYIRQSYLYGRGNYTVALLHPDHVLLKALKTGGAKFIPRWVRNIMGVFRFARFMTARSKKYYDFGGYITSGKLFTFFALHRLFYCLGWLRQYFSRQKEKLYLTQIPNSLILVITHKCNLTCRICDIWQTSEESEDLSTAEIIDVVRQAHSQGIPEICFSGGEPLMHKDIYSIFKFLENEKIYDIGLLSNGILINRNFEKLKPYLAKGIINPLISLDSLEPKVHQYMRDSNSCFADTTAALKKLSRLKKSFADVDFNVITIVCRDNLAELVDIASYVYKLGANTIQFQCMLPNNMVLSERKSNRFTLSTENERKLLREAIDNLCEIKRQYPDFIVNTEFNLEQFEDYYFGSDETNADEVVCFSSDRTILIATDGSYSSCFGSYGNIRSDSLKDVLSSKARKKQAKKTKRKCKKPCVLPCFCDVKFMEN